MTPPPIQQVFHGEERPAPDKRRAAAIGRTLDAVKAAGSGPLAAIFPPLLGERDLADIESEAGRLRNLAGRIIVLGMGGASLGAHSLLRIRGRDRMGPDIEVMTNLGAARFNDLIESIESEDTHFLCISKSGGTTETLAQTLLALQHVRYARGDNAVAKHFTFLTANADSPLHALADRFGIPVLDHPGDLPGRYSVLSIVGLLPAAAGGIDIRAVRDGARRVLLAAQEAANPEESAPARGALFSVPGEKDPHAVNVMMPYLDRLAPFADWYSQLSAESLGKDGHGVTPLAALGPRDQHSLLQLFLDGPVDKTFTFLCRQQGKDARRIDSSQTDIDGLGPLREKRLSDIVYGLYYGTRESLSHAGRPVRSLVLEDEDAPALGGLYAHFMLETVIAAGLLGVDAFNQPRVEDGKNRAREYLSGTESEA